MGSRALLKSRYFTSDKSEPAANAFPPAPVRVITRTWSSAAALSTAACRSSSVARDMALCFSGRLIVISAMGPRTEYRTLSKSGSCIENRCLSLEDHYGLGIGVGELVH